MNDYDSPYAALEAVLFIEAHPDLSFRIEDETRLIASPTEQAREHSARIRELKWPIMDVIGREWTRHRARHLVDQIHKYITHVVLASGMVETLEYVDGALGAEEPTLLAEEQHTIEAAIDAAAKKEDWSRFRSNVACYVNFWRSVHNERIENEEAVAA